MTTRQTNAVAENGCIVIANNKGLGSKLLRFSETIVPVVRMVQQTVSAKLVTFCQMAKFIKS